MTDEIIQQLTEIRDLLKENLVASQILAEKRLKNAEYQRKYRNQGQDLNNGCNITYAIKENEKEKEDGKRDLSPKPPIERKGEEKEKARENSHTARAREENGQLYLDGIASEQEVKADRERHNAQWLADNTPKLFDEFWEIYPKKVGRRKCAEKFAALLKAAVEERDIAGGVSFVAALHAGLAKWKRSDTWINNDGNYVCNPETWLNQGRWEDEPKEYRHRNPRPLTSSQAIMVDMDLPI